MSPPSDQRLDDADLVAIARRGGARGQRAFEALVRRHQAWLVRLITYILGSQAQAEEVAQEAFIKAYEALDGFRGDASFRGWMRVIATRLAYNHRASVAARTRREDATAGPLGEQGHDPRPAVEAQDALLRVLGTLPYPYREILLLRYVEELPIQEIASVLDIGLSAAKMRLSRARAAFWESYEENT